MWKSHLPQLQIHASHSGEYKVDCGLGLCFSDRYWSAVLCFGVCVCVCVSFDEVVVSTSGFPFQLFVGHHPTKCIYEESQAAPKYAALYSVSEVLLASISEEILTLRDLARLVMHKNKIFHSGKKFSLSECSWTQYRIPLHEPTEPTVKWPKAVLQEPSPESLVTGRWQPLS